MKKFKRYDSDGGAAAVAVAQTPSPAAAGPTAAVFLKTSSVRPPLQQSDLDACQAALGVVLPSAYVELLRTQNGGFLKHCAHPAPPNSWASNHVPVEYLPGIGEAARDEELPDLLGLQAQREPSGVPATLVLLAGDSRHFVALDYGAAGPTGEPGVVFWQRGGDTVPVAPTVAAFLAGLCDLEDTGPAPAPSSSTGAALVDDGEEDDGDDGAGLAGWGMAALLGPDLDEDDDDDGSFEAAQGGDDEDEEIVDDGELPEGELAELEEDAENPQQLPPAAEAAQQQDDGEDAEAALPPGKKRARY